jgi:hypothetical protein
MKKALKQTAFLFCASAILAQVDHDYLVLIRLTMLSLGSIVVVAPLLKEVLQDLISSEQSQTALTEHRY